MNRWRTITLFLLLAAPVLSFIGVGAWSLWMSGHLFWLWFSLPIAWGAAFGLARYWNRRLVTLDPPEFEPALHWTPRDKAAWKLIETRIAAADDVDPTEFTNMQFYLDTAQSVAEEISLEYHPNAHDPFGALTIPEIMAAAQLALEDLAEIYAQYVPGGQVISVNNWRTLSKFPKHYKTISNIATAAYALFSPIAAVGRYAVSKSVMGPVTKQLQANVLTWFYTSFLQRVGFYAIEMNSGRLRGGSKKFREAFERLAKTSDKPWEWTANPTTTTTEVASDDSTAKAPTEDTSSPVDDEPDVTESTAISVCLVGQAGSGKTNLARSFCGDNSEEAELLPKTRAVNVHRLHSENASPDMLLLDTRGYSAGDEDRRIDKDLKRALPQADLILLVLDVTSSARDADVKFLAELTSWYGAHPELKPPPVIAVLTHIDLLRPVMEWKPPYDWQNPTRPKEESIRDALEHNRGEMGDGVVDVVPVCCDVDNDRVFGFREWLVPAMSASIDDARACGMLRDLHSDLDHGKVQKVFEQVWNIGKSLRGK